MDNNGNALIGLLGQRRLDDQVFKSEFATEVGRIPRGAPTIFLRTVKAPMAVSIAMGNDGSCRHLVAPIQRKTSVKLDQ